MEKIVSYAYGNVLMYGSYSILEFGGLGYVSTIDKYVKVTVTNSSTKEIVITLSDFDLILSIQIKKNKISFSSDDKRLNFLKTAIKNIVRYLNSKRIEIQNMNVSVKMQSEFRSQNIKTGFGSSAAFTVAFISAILNFHGIEERESVHTLSKKSHYQVQNSGSGYDIASSCFGSHLFIQRQRKKENCFTLNPLSIPSQKTIQKLNWPSKLQPLFIFSGREASTKDYVKKILDFKKKNRKQYEEFINKYQNVNLRLTKHIFNNNLQGIKKNIEMSWRYRKKLGEMCCVEIENSEDSKLIQEINNNGAFFAGFLGAGGGDVIGAFTLSDKDRNNLKKFLSTKNMACFENVKMRSLPYNIVKLNNY